MSPSSSSFLIGFPTRITFTGSKYSVLGKETKTFFAHCAVFWFESPGTTSDSCTNTGIRKILAQKVTAIEPDPPLLKTKSGLILKIIKKLCKTPAGILNIISIKFSHEKYLLSFPEMIVLIIKSSCDSKISPNSSFGPI